MKYPNVLKPPNTIHYFPKLGELRPELAKIKALDVDKVNLHFFIR